MKILYYYNLRNRLRTKNEDSTFYLKPPYYAVWSVSTGWLKIFDLNLGVGMNCYRAY